MPGTGLNALQINISFDPHHNLWSSCYYYYYYKPPFTVEKTEGNSLSDLPKVMQLGWIWTQVFSLYHLDAYEYIHF